MNSIILDNYLEKHKNAPFVLEICFSDMKCNMNCAYCYGDHKNRSFNNSFPLNKKFLAEEFKKFKNPVDEIHLWGGELTFNESELRDTVSFVKEHFPDAQVHMVTNGILLPQWVDYFIENKIHIGLSHDGPGQKYRGMDYLESSEHNNAIRKLYDEKLFRKFKTVQHNKNFSTKAIISYFDAYSSKIGRKVGCDVMLISPNSLSDNTFIFKSDEDKKNLYEDTIWTTLDIIKNLEKNPGYLYRYYQLSDIYHVVKVLDTIANNKTQNYIAFCDGTRSTAFTSDGKHIPCHCFSEKVIVNKEIKVDPSYVYKKCSKCDFSYLCGGGCAAHTNSELDMYCEYAKVKYSAITQAVVSAKNSI